MGSNPVDTGILHVDVVSDKLRSMPNGYLQVGQEVIFAEEALWCLEISKGSAAHKPEALH